MLAWTALSVSSTVLTFWYGSDKYATAEVEQEYLSVISETGWPNPTDASAGRYTMTVGPTGVKMYGPYDYDPPSYWADAAGATPIVVDGWNVTTK